MGKTHHVKATYKPLKNEPKVVKCLACGAQFEQPWPGAHLCHDCCERQELIHERPPEQSGEEEVAECKACHCIFLATEIMGSGVCVDCAAEYAEEFILPYDNIEIYCMSDYEYLSTAAADVH